MANKDKILAAAQKYLQKNNLARAIKEYQKVLEIDSKDVRSRQKLAELYNRTGKVEQALEHYETVAKYYADNTFYLKAIAVYKLMQKLDPDNLEYTLKLAKLNEQQGLVGNALSEYRSLLQHYEESGEYDDAVKILNSMREIDPDNVSIGMRIAEFYAKVGEDAVAHDEFCELERRIREQGDYRQMRLLYEHFMQLWPDDVSVKIGYGVATVEYGDPAEGVRYLIKLQRQYPRDVEVLHALARGFRKCAEFKNEAECLLRLVEWEPENLDFQLECCQALLDSGEAEKAFTSIEAVREQFFTAERVAELKPLYEQMREELPDKRDLLTALHAIYEYLGEGEKLFDVLSSEAVSADAGEFTPSSFDDLIGEGGDRVEFEEMELGAGDTGASSTDEVSFDDISFDIVGDDDSGAAEDMFDIGGGEAAAVVDVQTDLEEADFYLQQGLLEEARQVCDRLLAQAPDNADVKARIAQIEERRSQSSAADGVDVAIVADVGGVDLNIDVADDSGLDLDLDLGSISSGDGLGDSLDFDASDLDIDSSLAAIEAKAEQVAAETPQLADSQRGVVTVITDEDTESAYNLGIAYKEMGLLDDAIAEFDKAMNDPARKLDCITLKAACYMEQQQFEQAEEMLTAALIDSTFGPDDQIVIYYETGQLYEAWGRPADALASYQVVADNNSAFRNVAIKIIELKEQLGDDAPSSDTSRVSYI